MQANKPYISTGLRHIFAIVSSQIKLQLWWSHPTPSWSTKQPIGDKKSAHVTLVSYPVFLSSIVLVSPYNRCFMSQARRTRHFSWSAKRVRSVRLGEAKNKLFFSSPRVALRTRLAPCVKCRVCLAWFIKRLLCRLVLVGCANKPSWVRAGKLRGDWGGSNENFSRGFAAQYCARENRLLIFVYSYTRVLS